MYTVRYNNMYCTDMRDPRTKKRLARDGQIGIWIDGVVFNVYRTDVEIIFYNNNDHARLLIINNIIITMYNI